jgi:hypothetical protein
MAFVVQEDNEKMVGTKFGVERGTNLKKPAPTFTLVSCSAYSSNLKMEAIYSSETSVNFLRTK